MEGVGTKEKGGEGGAVTWFFLGLCCRRREMWDGTWQAFPTYDALNHVYCAAFGPFLCVEMRLSNAYGTGPDGCVRVGVSRGGGSAVGDLCCP